MCTFVKTDKIAAAKDFDYDLYCRRMPKKRNLSVEERSAVVTLSGEGYSQRGIPKKLKMSLCAVQNI